MKTDPAVLTKAEAVRAEIEREAQTRQKAIAAIFSGEGTQKGKAPSRSTSPAAKTAGS